jgi:ATP-binding protein involved in chromosome partitioning
MDPRLSIIDKRLKNVDRIISVASGKGGVGKSLVASTLALNLSKKYRVGLLDLDFYGPSSHIILGIKDAYPKEEKGIIPPKIHGIKFMSIIYYTEDKPSPLRGADVSNAIIELLAITRWGSLDFLIIDLPPGIGDETLDVIRFMKSEFLVITTPSKVVVETVKKLLALLKELKIPIIGVIENMKIADCSFIKNQINALEFPFLGEIWFDKNLESSIGNVNKLLKTNFAKEMKKIANKI